MIQTGQKDTPGHMTSCSAYKPGGRWLWSGSHCLGTGWVARNCVVHCLCILLLLLLFPFLFCPIKLSLSQPMSVNFFPVLSTIPLGVNEQMAVQCLAYCWVKPQHTYTFKTGYILFYRSVKCNFIYFLQVRQMSIRYGYILSGLHSTYAP